MAFCLPFNKLHKSREMVSGTRGRGQRFTAVLPNCTGALVMVQTKARLSRQLRHRHLALSNRRWVSQDRCRGLPVNGLV
jgi:hypothetical protein